MISGVSTTSVIRRFAMPRLLALTSPAFTVFPHITSPAASAPRVRKRNRSFCRAIPLSMTHQLTLIALLAIWPFSSAKDYHMTADPSVPAAAGTVHAQRDKDNKNTKLDIKVEHLAAPGSLNPPASTYLVWVRPLDQDAIKEGAIGVGKDLKGEIHIVTVSRDFDVFITPEQSESVTVPSSTEVLRAHVNMD